MKSALILFAMVAIVALVAGCANEARQSTQSDFAGIAPGSAPMPEAPAMEESAPDSGGGAEPAAQPAPDPRKMIYQSFISILVKDPAASMATIEDMTTEAGGYVSQSQLNQYFGELMRGQIVIRVPVEGYTSLLERIRALGIRVLNENGNANDVTAEYTDLEAQLRNLEAAERELQAMLTEVRERPNARPADILEVYNALSTKRGEIEQVKGRLQYLSNQVSLSTITVDLVPDEGEKPVLEESWQPLVTIKNAVRTLVTALQGLIDAAITILIVVVPILLLIALPIAVLVWLVRRWRARRKATPPPA
jgi:hypothetical protein